MRIGVISDTHGLLRPQALEALEDSDLIIHAGDVGPLEILDQLRAIAPVRAVRGNTDRGAIAAVLPLTEVVEVPGAGEGHPTLLYVIHILEDLDLDPGAAGFRCVICGHSHRPEVREERGVLYLNPGSAGPRRFDLPVTVARLRIDPAEGTLDPEIVHIL